MTEEWRKATCPDQSWQCLEIEGDAALAFGLAALLCAGQIDSFSLQSFIFSSNTPGICRIFLYGLGFIVSTPSEDFNLTDKAIQVSVFTCGCLGPLPAGNESPPLGKDCGWAH